MEVKMERIPKEVIIIGGGYSLKEGISKGLWNKIKNKFTIGCNSNFNHFSATINTFVDKDFYLKNQAKLHQLPLVIGKKHGGLNERENLYLFMTANEYYGKESLKLNKVYSGVLVGIFSITLSICFGCELIFLLGFDWTKKTFKKDSYGKVVTHYYQNNKDLWHRGIGLTNFYDTHKPDDYFNVFLKEPVKIYNVSLISNINCFEKISYDEFFSQISNLQDYEQEEVREKIKKLLKESKNG